MHCINLFSWDLLQQQVVQKWLTFEIFVDFSFVAVFCVFLWTTVVEHEPDDDELDIVSGGIQLTIGSMPEQEFYGSSSWRSCFIFDKNDKK